MTETQDMTVQILLSIRDEIRGTNGRVDQTNQRLDQTNQRLDQTNRRLDQTNQKLDEGLGGINQKLDGTNQRLDRVEETLVELAEQQRFVVRHLQRSQNAIAGSSIEWIRSKSASTRSRSRLPASGAERDPGQTSITSPSRATCSSPP